MSHHEYIVSIKLQDTPFYALIMAAMRRADSDNVEKLKRMFPETWSELFDRYHAPGGVLPGECEP